MSGFAGIVNLDGARVDVELLDGMTRFLAFRGRDAQRTWIGNNAGLGHVLLSFAGSLRDEQPLTLDGRRWIVADARIDRREDLIAELRSRGHAMVACQATDAELILRAYDVWDESCVAHLLGDFAFALWDEPRQRLFGARDHLGVKPFFYARAGDVVVIGNTLDCVRLHPAVSSELNESAIADFLLFGVNQDSGTTVFRDIQRLPPAHCITWSRDLTRRQRYWTLPVEEPIHFKRAGDYSDRFLELLRTSLRDRLRTRRVGVLMSGGIDSTTIAAMAVKVLREQPSDFSLQAITSVYDRLVPDSERYYADLVAKHLNIPIRYDVRDEETSLAHWDRVAIHTPEPVDNPPAFAAGVEFFRTMAADTPVFLYGEGPDNALRYEWRGYLAHLVGTRRVGALVRAVSSDLVMHPRIPFWSSIRHAAAVRDRAQRPTEPFPRWLNEEFAARCECRERWAARQRASASPHPVRPRAYDGFGDVRWQSLFEDCDVAGAMSRAEIRHPFLDLPLLRYLLAVPAMPWCRNKLIIRASMQTSLPRAVLERPKTSVGASPDFERVKALGFPRLVPSPELLRYVNPVKIATEPRDALEMRSALRPLGLNVWLRDYSRRH